MGPQGNYDGGWFFLKLNKDVARNNCWHHAYLKDIPEIRAALRKTGIDTEKAKAIRNWKGQTPKQLRHANKAEVSSGEDTSEVEDQVMDK